MKAFVFEVGLEDVPTDGDWIGEKEATISVGDYVIWSKRDYWYGADEECALRDFAKDMRKVFGNDY